MTDLAKKHGDDAAYYAKTAQVAYNSIKGEGKTREKQEKAYNYINSLNISNAEKGAIIYTAFGSDSKQYQKAVKQFGDIGAYQLFNYKNEADTHKDKGKALGKDGKVSKEEAQAYIKNNNLDYDAWYPLLYSYYKEKK